MRLTQALGRPGTQVIPDGWQESHGQVFAKTMPAKVNLRKPGSTKTQNPTTQVTEYVPLAPYAADQRARIQPQTSRAVDSSAEQATETLQVVGYLVTLVFDRPLNKEPAVGDLVDVLGCTDPLLTGRSMLITEVVRSSMRFERDVFCTLTDPAST